MRMLSTLILLAGTVPATALAQPATGQNVEFNRNIRPILSNSCFACHGPDTAARQAGLRLDQRELATQPLDSGLRAIVPGDSASSELIQRIQSGDPDVRMPPPESNRQLTAIQRQLLARWIDQGAEYETHWAFVAPRRSPLPTVRKTNWVRQDIDRFVLAQLEAKRLQPAPEATRETLIRRVAFDLTGLPPTLQEVDAFLADKSARAYEHMVDRYLTSPAYGEHMARHWLDLARYADSNGYQYDTERQQWVWRDWVIDAYNRNLSFDQFSIQQLAGDLLPNATPQQRLATGFNRNHGITIEGGIIDEEYRVEYVMDRLVTTGSVWLGLTIGCARCHEHKYDPISQREFYQLYAFFNQVPERGMRGFQPMERIPSPLAEEKIQAIDRQLAALNLELQKPVEIDPLLARWAAEIADSPTTWQILTPESMSSSGGSKMTRLDDNSILVGPPNPDRDVYEITAPATATRLTAVRLEALTHPTLPAGGPGRHSNSNFVLSEFELDIESPGDPTSHTAVQFSRALADYSQRGYEIAKAIDGVTNGNNGWAVDGPTRKQPATAIFVLKRPIDLPANARLRFRLKHVAGFKTHGIGRPRLSISSHDPDKLDFEGPPADLIAIAKQPAAERSESQQQRLRQYFLQHHGPHIELQAQIEKLQAARSQAFPETMVMRDLEQPRPTFVLTRGAYDAPADPVSPDVPEIFPRLPAETPRNRLALAQWLFDPAHPLTARVAVNRHWERLFGIGLVKTSEDFGLQGELPSHPQLLDWLAVEFIESGWDVKHLLRLILVSATYRQSSHVGQEAYRTDPDNRLLARGPRIRLTAEEIRDNALAVSGLLVNRLGGRSVYPYQPPGLWLELNNRPGYSQAYQPGSGDALYRRSLYTFWKRTVPSPMLKTLDAPEREFCTLNRSRTNTPLQALLLLNGTQFVEAARHLAVRMLEQGGADTNAKLEYGFRLVTARRPTAAEIDVLRAVYESELVRFQNDAAAAERVLRVGESARGTTANPARHAAWTSVARMLLNLNEAITKG